MNPDKLVMRKAELIESGTRREVIQGYENMCRSARLQGDNLFPPDATGESIARTISHTALMAENFTLSDDMGRLVKHAAMSMPPEPLLPYDLPSPSGYVVLPEPLEIRDIRGETLRIRSVLWEERNLGGRPGDRLPESRGLLLWMFTDLTDPRDPLFQRLSKSDPGMLRILPEDSLVHAQSIGYGRLAWHTTPDQPIGRRLAMADVHDGEIVEVHGGEGGYTKGASRYTIRTHDGTLVTVEPDPTVQWLQAFFHFVKSELAAKEDGYLRRGTLSLLRRMGQVPGPVTVITLRRMKGQQHADDGMWTLTERHVRRGHWRRQWYGPQDARFQRYVWINPTIVGPEDAPLRVRETVNVLAR